MLAKFFRVNRGHDEPGGVDYLLDNPTARIVRGSPELVKSVIDQIPPGRKQRFTAGVISDLSRLDRCHDDGLLAEFQLMLLAGRPESSMLWCAIEHTDKDKRELHFVIVLLDLLFGKFENPYIDRIDRHGFAAWVEQFALRHDLEIPSEKLRVKPPFEHCTLRKVDTEFLEEVWHQVSGWVQGEEVTCRNDLERKLAEEGHQVRFYSRKKPRPLEQPRIIGPDGNELPLRGSTYYRIDFGSPCVKPIDRTDTLAVKSRIAELEQIIQNRMEFRAHHLIGRLFGSRQKKLADKTTAKDKARKCFQELIDQTLENERRTDELWKKIEFDHIWTMAELKRSKVPDSIWHPEVKKPSEGKINEQDDCKKQEFEANAAGSSNSSPGNLMSEPHTVQLSPPALKEVITAPSQTPSRKAAPTIPDTGQPQM